MIDLADNMEVIVSAVDEASSIFQAIADSCIEMFDSITGSGTEASTVIDEIGIAAEESSISADELGSSLSTLKVEGLMRLQEVLMSLEVHLMELLAVLMS